MNTYAVADLHGRIDVLEAALAAIEADATEGVVVFLGDYVDRGPASRQVVERLIAGPKDGWKWICLKGNHEDMMLGALVGEDETSTWLGNGGRTTLWSYSQDVPASHLKWMADLPLYHIDGLRVFVHAGLDETLPLTEQSEAMLLWSRTAKTRDYSVAEGYVVHGHTPFEDGPIVLSGRANLDTGAVWTGKLLVAVFNDSSNLPTRFLRIQCPPLDELVRRLQPEG